MHRFDTRIVHNSRKNNPDKALTPPIAMTSTFYFESIKDAQDAFNFVTDDYVYTRGNNPTLRLLEEKMAILEGGNSSCAFSSGMGAVSSTLLSLLKPGDELICHNTLYGSSHSFTKEFLSRYSINAIFADLTDLKSFEELINEKVKVVYFETPSNPNLEVINIEKIVQISNKFNIKVIVDNTFLSPYFQRPLELGAYAVLHSATKFLSGHGDLVAGIVISKDNDFIHNLKFGYMCELGSVLSPFNAWLILRGLKTLHVRMKRHEENTLELYEYLKNNKKFTNLNHPSGNIKTFMKEQMKGYGSLITVELNDSRENIIKFIDNLKLFRIAVSLGDTESLIQVPALMTHMGYSDADLKKAGISKNMIRISVGLEDVKDLIEDIENSLSLL
jgi:methionine-gamma-lyase